MCNTLSHISDIDNFKRIQNSLLHICCVIVVTIKNDIKKALKQLAQFIKKAMMIKSRPSLFISKHGHTFNRCFNKVVL